jgi:Ca2+-binding RTX toxin-like protein
MSIPLPEPDQFSTTIDNLFLPLKPGTSFVYEDKDDGSTDVVAVTRQTKVVDGVECVVVHDSAYQNGLLVEDTFDWYAQDADGNVWYFGELSRSYEPGNPVPVDTHGSWQAGVNGATPGIVMLANPQVGDAYQQEFAAGVAEDRAKVLALDADVNVAYGLFDGVLETREVNPLDPSTELKYYAAGVGNLLTTDNDGAFEQLVQVILNGTRRADTLVGYAGGDDIFGMAGDDRISGGRGNDMICGGKGDDVIAGGSGHDHLNGGAGNNHLRGGEGSDTFVFRHLHDGIAETNTIADYTKDDLDVIDLARGTASVASEALVNGVWELTLIGDGDVIRLIGVADANYDGHIVDDLHVP